MPSIRRVFVTGASSGLGRGLALHYARAGAQIGLVARRESLLKELAGELAERGASAQIYAGDVSDTAFMQDSAQAFVAAAGGVDLVFANAGVGIANKVREGESAEVAWLMSINVIGVTNTVLPFVPQMLKQKSGILCAVSSVAGHRAMPGRAAYSASKACVTTFMEGLRQDLSGSGVHSMALCPGFVETAFTRDNPRMMFVIGVDEAVTQMTGAIEAHKRTFTFPWQMNLLKEVLTRVPESWVRRMAPPPRTKSMS